MSTIGIGAEFAVFLHALLSGILVSCIYLSIRVMRRLISHKMWMMNLEDILFWLCTAMYLFVQIYYTSSGNIRWYFILGVVFGTLFAAFFWKIVKKISEKIYAFIRKKFENKPCENH